MNQFLCKMSVVFQELKSGDAGQDMAEYALVVAVIALSAIAGVSQVAVALTSAFNSISTTLSSSL